MSPETSHDDRGKKKKKKKKEKKKVPPPGFSGGRHLAPASPFQLRPWRKCRSCTAHKVISDYQRKIHQSSKRCRRVHVDIGNIILQMLERTQSRLLLRRTADELTASIVANHPRRRISRQTVFALVQTSPGGRFAVDGRWWSVLWISAQSLSSPVRDYASVNLAGRSKIHRGPKKPARTAETFFEAIDLTAATRPAQRPSPQRAKRR